MQKRQQIKRQEKRSNVVPFTEPLHSQECEQAVLGSILLDNAVMGQIIDIIKPDDFFESRHRRLFELMLNMHKKDKGIDYVTVEDEFRLVGETEIDGNYLSELCDNTPTLANLETYAQRISDYANVRRLKAAALSVCQQPFSQSDNFADFAARAESVLLKTLTRAQQGLVSDIKQILFAAYEELEKRYEEHDKPNRLQTGFTALDAMLRMDPGNLVYLAARPAMGKSAFALSIIKNICERGFAAVLFSLEMDIASLGARLLADQASVDLGRMRNARMGDYEWSKLANAANELNKINLFIDDTPCLRMVEIRSRAKRLQAELERQGKTLGLVALDYLQLCSADNRWDIREREIADLSRGLKSMARELKLPVLALSQLNRKVEQREDKRPKLSDLRESGAMEQDADAILFIYRDEYYHENSSDTGTAEVIIGKQRNGPTGTVKLGFQPEYTRFENLEVHHG